LRNPYDLSFDADGRLFVTDNGPDYGGPELLYHAEENAQFLFPYYPDCDFCPQTPSNLDITEPIATFVPHGAIAGITSYTHTAFPEQYYNSLFVALWSAFPDAQKIVHVQTYPTQTTDFLLGLAAPIDVIQTPSGGIAVADWATGHIFQVSIQQ
jgi:glucose/arabinose dehydrogenase